jgi:hypothetical protein
VTTGVIKQFKLPDVGEGLTEAEIKTLAEPDFTASLRRSGPTLDVLAEEKIPAAYWKPQPPKLDRQGLLAALKNGAEFEGPYLPHLISNWA